MKKILYFGFLLILIAVALFFVFRNKNGNGLDLTLVEVSRDSIAEKALAIGTIEPDKEINVKSAISGIISDVYFKIGDVVKKNTPLFKISPNPTPLEYAEAQRNRQIADVTLKQAQKERQRSLKLFEDNLISRSEMERVDSLYDELNLRYKIADERFQLLEEGRIKISDKNINSIIKSPIDGVVLNQNVYEGDPVVPLTNFQPGTELCAMADLNKMLFKGTVDEIDVGKMEPGMTADIQIGALPQTVVEGKLQRISPKARKEGNATLFDIEVSIEKVSGKSLRAGYSATAYVIIQEKDDVLIIPERLVIFEGDKRFVEVMDAEEVVKREITTGLSDGLNVEVVRGLTVNDRVIERPPREIE